MPSIFDFAVAIFSFLLLIPAMYLAWLSFGSILQRVFGKTHDSKPASGHVAIVVPSHNEELDIAATVASLKNAADENTSIHVVADNCNDATAARARDAGAIVWERSHETLRSKGYALEWAIPQVMAWGDAQSCHVAFVAVVDADASLSNNSLPLVRKAFALGADVLQSEYLLNRGEHMRARIASIGFAAMNVVRGLGRLWWGGSDTLKGNGMWFRREILDKYPWRAYSLAEDFEYAIHLIRSGVRITILPGSVVTGAPARSGKGLQEQRVRWEAGRLALVTQTLPAIVRDFVRSPSLRQLDLFCEIVTPPLALVVTIYALALIWEPTRYMLGLGGLALLTFHVAVTIPVAKLPFRTFLDLLSVPFYVCWKIALLPLVWARRRSKTWVRAER
jgi:cellulose synthase/poly-beta-1,6-N-acetylglucosamine synthase-like glycosyltransferase